jgi:hypothetical protein
MITEKNGVKDSGTPANSQAVVRSRYSGKEKDLRKDFLDTTNLVRSIQRAEGNPDCFRKAENYCDRLDCSWRQYCLTEEGPHPKEGM